LRARAAVQTVHVLRELRGARARKGR